MHRLSIICAIALAVTTPVSGGVVLISENFNAGSAVDSQADFESVFSVNFDASNNWSYGAGGGVDGTGSVFPSSGQNDIAAIHRTGFDGFGTHTTLTAQLTTQIDSTATPPGFSSIDFTAFLTETEPAPSPVGAGTRINGLFFQLDFDTSDDTYRIDINGQTLDTIPVTDFTAGNFVRWTASWTLDESDDLFDLTLILEDLGPAGTSSPTPIDTYNAQDILDADVLNADTLFVGFEGRARAGIGADRLDDLSVTAVPIPEPGSLALLGLGAWCVLGGRARA